MVQFFNAKKSSDDELATPLMADEPSALTSRDHERESKRSQREKDRKTSEGQLAGSKAGSVSSSKSKSSKTIVTQEELDEADVKMGCCYTFGGILVKSIQLIDGLIGLIFVVYGSLIMTQFDNPAMAAAITCLTFGSVLLFGSIMGGIGFTTKVCKRIGIALSAYLAPCVAFFYLVVIIALLADHATFFNYLTEHKDVLYLSSSEITSLNDLLPFFYIVLIALGVMEMLRYFGLIKLRAKLIKRDVAREHISERARYGISSGGSEASGLTDVFLDDVEA